MRNSDVSVLLSAIYAAQIMPGWMCALLCVLCLILAYLMHKAEREEEQ